MLSKSINTLSKYTSNNTGRTSKWLKTDRELLAMREHAIDFSKFIMESYHQTADGYYYHYQDVDREGYPIKDKIVTDEQLYELFNNPQP